MTKLIRMMSPVALLVMSSVAAADGKAVYNDFCTSCHAAGIAGAPKIGDKDAWAQRIAKGTDVLYKNSVNGFQGDAGYMPAKGGNPDLTDAQVKSAVDYMISQSQ